MTKANTLRCNEPSQDFNNEQFRQGIVLGTIVANEYSKTLARTFSSVRSLEEAFDQAVDHFREIKPKYVGMSIPEFPDGIPDEAFNEVEEILMELLAGGLL